MTVPIYDGRGKEMDLSAACPFQDLPPFRFDLKRGDFVWFGFHVTDYVQKSQNVPANFAGLNIAWIVILGRGGEYSWEEIQEPKCV